MNSEAQPTIHQEDFMTRETGPPSVMDYRESVRLKNELMPVLQQLVKSDFDLDKFESAILAELQKHPQVTPPVIASCRIMVRLNVHQHLNREHLFSSSVEECAGGIAKAIRQTLNQNGKVKG